MSESALEKAAKGQKVSDRQAQSALGRAVGKISSLTKRAETNKEAVMETGAAVLHTAETQGSLFLSSMAEGYFGEDKLKVGSVDVRAPVGLLAQGYGIYQTLRGKGGGAHALALGNGVMGSWLANVARNAGRTLAEKRDAKKALPPAVIEGARGLLPEPGMDREILLTPADDDRRLRRPRRESRFVRASA